jgi:hypothetical protein
VFLLVDEIIDMHLHHEGFPEVQLVDHFADFPIEIGSVLVQEE